MKRHGRSFIIVLLIVAVFIAALGLYFFLTSRKIPEARTRRILKDFTFLSPSSLDEWDEKVLARKSTGYTVTEHEGKACVKAVSEDSASALYYKQRLSFEQDPFISWDWKADKFPLRSKEEKLDKKSEFDFVAQVYVIFYARFFLNSKAIQYVWTEHVPQGTYAYSPYTKNVRIMVLESGPSEGWKHEERDIRSDFAYLFGMELEKDVTAISFMTDSDSTDTESSAFFSNFKIGYLEKPIEGSSEDKKDLRAVLTSWFLKLPFFKDKSKQEIKEEVEVKKKIPGEVEVKKKVKVEEGQRKERPSDI